MRVKPSRNFVIRDGKRVRQCESRTTLWENEEVCHKKASKTNPNLIPVKRENTQIRNRNEPSIPLLWNGVDAGHCIKVQVPVEKGSEPVVFGRQSEMAARQARVPDASVDLVYLDPPFNSNADYNVLFREPSGQVSQAQFRG